MGQDAALEVPSEVALDGPTRRKVSLFFTSGGSNADSVNPAAPRQLVFTVSYVYNLVQVQLEGVRPPYVPR